MIDFEKGLLNRIASLEVKDGVEEKTSTEIREQYQYGTELSIKDDMYEELLKLAKEVILRTKVILRE